MTLTIKVSINKFLKIQSLPHQTAYSPVTAKSTTKAAV